MITNPFKNKLTNFLSDKDFFKLLWFINQLKNILVDGEKFLLNVETYKDYWDRILVKETIPYGEMSDKNIIKRLVHNFRKQPISLYDMDDFHMELRVFSLDDLFTSLGAGVTGKDITSELYKFVEMTNTMMINIIDRFNKFFDKTIRGIPDTRMQHIWNTF